MTELQTETTEPRIVTDAERLAFMTLKVQQVVAEKNKFMQEIGRESNADLGCQILFDKIDGLALALGEHGARELMLEIDLARTVCTAVRSFVLAQQKPSGNVDEDNALLNSAFHAIFHAAQAYFDHVGHENAPVYGPDDNAVIFNDGEPELTKH